VGDLTQSHDDAIFAKVLRSRTADHFFARRVQK